MLNRDFTEFVGLLNSHDVRYLVVGGYALAAHGHPRYTKDLDVWVWIDPENARRLIAALEEFGFGTFGLKPEDFLEPGTVIQLGYPPSRIDLLTRATGVDFDTCFASRVQVEIDGLPIDFIDLDNLRQNKQATGRLQDLADIEQLQSGSDR